MSSRGASVVACLPKYVLRRGHILNWAAASAVPGVGPNSELLLSFLAIRHLQSAQSTQQMMQVTVPDGVGPGELVKVNFGGQLMTVTVPPGCHPGMTFDAPAQSTQLPAEELARRQAQRKAAEAEAVRVQEEKEYGADDPDSDLAVR